jgi:hypothetical protein
VVIRQKRHQRRRTGEKEKAPRTSCATSPVRYEPAKEERLDHSFLSHTSCVQQRRVAKAAKVLELSALILRLPRDRVRQTKATIRLNHIVSGVLHVWRPDEVQATGPALLAATTVTL